MEGLYNHTVQSDTQLSERLAFLIEHIQLPHIEERRQAIRKEMACIIFEMLQRDKE